MPRAVNGMKECSKCGETKSVSEYYKSKTSKDGLRSRCKECLRQYEQDNSEHIAEWGKRYRQANREELRIKKAQYYRDNMEYFLSKSKTYRQNNREKLVEYDKQYRQDNKDVIREKKKQYQDSLHGQGVLKQWRIDNSEKISEKARQYWQNNKEQLSAKKKKYNIDNSEKISEKARQYYQNNKESIDDRRAREKQEMPAAIYGIKCIPTGKEYVGQSSMYPIRWQIHRTRLRKGNHINLSLQSDYDEYGLDAFEFNIIGEYPCNTTSKILLEAETIEILKRVRAKQELYNNMIPQDDGRTFIDVDYTEEEFAKIIENSIKLDMTMTEFVCKAIHDFNLSHLPQNISETKEE